MTTTNTTTTAAIQQASQEQFDEAALCGLWQMRAARATSEAAKASSDAHIAAAAADHWTCDTRPDAEAAHAAAQTADAYAEEAQEANHATALHYLLAMDAWEPAEAERHALAAQREARRAQLASWAAQGAADEAKAEAIKDAARKQAELESWSEVCFY